MYYEESIIDDMLHFRLSPKDEWIPFSPAKLMVRIKELKLTIVGLRHTLANTLDRLSEIKGELNDSLN